MDLQRKTTPLALKRGSVIHSLLEAYLRGEDWYKELEKYEAQYSGLMDEEKEYYGDLPAECKRIMEGYIEQWKPFPVETLAVEVAFGMDGVPPLEIIPGVFMKGRIDWVFRDERGVWVADHKTVGKEIPNEAYRLQDMQTIIYSIALPMLGLPKPVGVMFDYLKTKPPTKPKILKNGTISTAKKIATDHRTFLQTIEENGLDPADYAEQLELAKLNKFYARKYIAKPKRMVDVLINELGIINWEIENLREKPYRNLCRDCNYCSYMTLCTAEMLGLDTEYLMKAEYETKKKEETKTEEEDEDESTD